MERREALQQCNIPRILSSSHYGVSEDSALMSLLSALVQCNMNHTMHCSTLDESPCNSCVWLHWTQFNEEQFGLERQSVLLSGRGTFV